MKFILFIVCIVVLFSSCSLKQTSLQKSATIVFKTKKMKFYDKGFINKYDNYINLQIYNVGTIVLNIDIYKDMICKGILQCINAKDFNKEFLSSTYKDEFLYELFNKKNIYHKDRINSILIKVKYDKILR